MKKLFMTQEVFRKLIGVPTGTVDDGTKAMPWSGKITAISNRAHYDLTGLTAGVDRLTRIEVVCADPGDTANQDDRHG